MKRLLIALATGAAALALPSVAGAQNWQSIDQRQQALYRTIDVGVRNGDLTNNEATQLRREYDEIVRIEAQYRRYGGLSNSEMRDLDHRLDILRDRIDYQLRDNQNRGRGDWRSIDAHQSALYQRIDVGLRNGGLSNWEATQLRRDLAAIERLEVQYRRGGLSDFERRDLDRRLDQVASRIRYERNDRDRRNWPAGYNGIY